MKGANGSGPNMANGMGPKPSKGQPFQWWRLEWGGRR